MDKQQAKASIAALVARYSEEQASLPNRKRLNEDQLGEAFIKPLFRALGWNTENPNEFTVELTIGRDRADYVFYRNGLPTFFVETKTASEQLDQAKYVQQSLKYARMRGVTWTVLTNFERLLVFNADMGKDDPDAIRWHNLSYRDYASSDGAFDLLWLLSKPAQMAGDMDREAELQGRKARRVDVTEVLFESLADWRARLFNQISSFDRVQKRRVFEGLPLLKDQPVEDNTRRVDNAIQRLLDRLIFIRTMEDRMVEEQRLKALAHRYPKQLGDLTGALKDLFREFDTHYNSNLFAPDPDGLDSLLPEYASDLLKAIIEGLYRNSAERIDYNFAYLNADVLGTVYEQYLSFKALDPQAEHTRGKTLKKKTQGIYYTPPYVVRYLVQQTLGTLLENGADPRTIRVLDPACGSGSFLIVAYDMLYNWRKGVEQPTTDAADRALREDILRNNLFGVDLDEQALEVTRLNLMVRASRERQHLPYLTNLRHGNSLIADAAYSATPFDWGQFGDGFDVVIGNPPYVRQETLGTAFKEYAEQHYTTYAGTADLYVYFVEKGLSLLRDGGRMGFIIPNKWMRANYGKHLRGFLRDRVETLIDFGELPVFRTASTFPLIMIAAHLPDVHVNVAQVKELPRPSQMLEDKLRGQIHELDRNSLDSDSWTLVNAKVEEVFKKMMARGVPLGQYVNGKIYRGILTGFNEAFVIDAATRDALIAQDARSAELIKPFLAGRDVKRYQQPKSERFLIAIPCGFTNEKRGDHDAWTWFEQTYPAVAAHLAPFGERAARRSDKGDYWWELRPCAYYEAFEGVKIVIPDIVMQSRAAYDTHSIYVANTIYFIPADDIYLLGILNSSAIWNYFKRHATVIGDADNGGRLRWFRQDIERLPVPVLEPDDPAHAHIVALVEKMLALKAQLATETRPDQSAILRADIATTDDAIDRAVYALYGLTDDEIALIAAP